MYRLFLLLAFLLIINQTHAQSGCTDPLAINYNASATINDGSCSYPATTISPIWSVVLSDTVKETSGLIYWNGVIWTHNDDTYNFLYALDTLDGHIIKKITIANAVNNDWEEVTQDSAYIYIGDFGNNANGNRTDLAIWRISKADIANGNLSVQGQKIAFSYSDQTNFAPAGPDNTDYDCESFLATNDSLYLFTKQWVSQGTNMYALPKIPGTYVAGLRAQYAVGGLVTGANYQPERRTVALCGYTISNFLLQPFVFLLYDFKNFNFFSGNKRMLTVNAAFHQTEGICTANGTEFFISNEQFVQSIINVPQQLAKYDLAPYLHPYFQSLGVGNTTNLKEHFAVYPNPFHDQFQIQLDVQKPGLASISLKDNLGRTVYSTEKMLAANGNIINLKVPNLAPGNYVLELVLNGQVLHQIISTIQ